MRNDLNQMMGLIEERSKSLGVELFTHTFITDTEGTHYYSLSWLHPNPNLQIVSGAGNDRVAAVQDAINRLRNRSD